MDIFPDRSDAFYEEILALRGISIAAAEGIDDMEAPSESLIELAKELEDEAFQIEIERWRQASVKAGVVQERARQEARTLMRPDLAADEPGANEGADAAPSGSGSGDRPPPRQPVGPPGPQFFDHRGLTKQEALQYAPPGATLRKDCTRYHRWQILGRHQLQASYSKAWGPTTGLSDNEALTHCLVLSWRDYTRMHGIECPFAFELFPFA